MRRKREKGSEKYRKKKKGNCSNSDRIMVVSSNNSKQL